MSTTYPFDPTDPNSAWSQFVQDVAHHSAAVATQNADATHYHNTAVPGFNAFIAAHKGHKVGESINYYFVVMMIMMLALQDDQMGVTGASLKTNAGTTEISNAISHITSADTSAIPPGQNQLQYVVGKIVKNPNGTINLSQSKPGLDVMLYLTDPKNVSDPSAASVQSCFDSSSPGQIFQQLQAIRNTINISGDTSGYDPGDGAGVYFSDTDSSKLGSFDEMKADLGKTEDPKHATEAQKAITNALSVLTSITQGINSALNERVSQQANFSKDVDADFTSLIKSWLDLMSSVIQLTQSTK